MIRIYNVSFFLFLFFFSSCLCWAGEINYYSPDGSIITKDEYDKLRKKNDEKIDKIRKEKIEALQKQTDKYGRPMFDSKGRRISNSFSDSEKEQKQKKELGHDFEVWRNKHPLYSEQPEQVQVNKTPEQKYWDERLRLERLKLYLDLMKTINKPIDDRPQYRFRLKDRTDERLKKIEENTKDIKRKLEWGW